MAARRACLGAPPLTGRRRVARTDPPSGRPRDPGRAPSWPRATTPGCGSWRQSSATWCRCGSRMPSGSWWWAPRASSHVTARPSGPKTCCATSASPSARRRRGRSTSGSWSGAASRGGCRCAGASSRTTTWVSVSLASQGMGLLTPLNPQWRSSCGRRLQRVLEPHAATVPGYFLYFPSRAQRSAALRLFVEAVRELSVRSVQKTARIRASGRPGRRRVRANLSAISCCWLPSTEQPLAQRNLPKLWTFFEPAASWIAAKGLQVSDGVFPPCDNRKSWTWAAARRP